MRKTIKTLILMMAIALMLVALAIPCFAVNSTELVVDKENLFDSNEEARLESYLYTISEKHQCEIVVVTKRSFGSLSAKEYAEDYYDSNGYGYGSDDSGVLLLISAEERYYYICTTGKGHDAIRGSVFKELSNEVKELLSSSRYYDASKTFAQMCDEALTSYEQNGKPFDSSALVTGIIVSAVIGIVASIITILVLKYKMNNARVQKHASYYERENSFDLRVSTDVYLYSTVRRVAKPKNNSSSSSRGGSRGGGGGRF
jgi:uncharacterized protein